MLKSTKTKGEKMTTCIVLYERVNLLSFAKVYDLLRRAKTPFDVVAMGEGVLDEHGFWLGAQVGGESLYGYDNIIIPDGLGALNARFDDVFLGWIKTAKGARRKIAVNLGSLVLGGAGFLSGKKASLRAGYANAMSEYAAPCEEAWCDEGDVLTMLDTPEAWERLAGTLDG